MRDIKFKAYQKESKKVYWFSPFWGNFNTGNGYIGMVPFGEDLDSGTLFGRKGNRELIDPAGCEIVESIGLTDKNGNEIFEGDIIRSFDSKGDPIVHYVYYSEDKAGFSCKLRNYGDCGISKNWVNEYEKEIIGNIYLTPELL